MGLADVVRDRLARSVQLYGDLIDELPEDALASRLPGLSSNSIGSQLWCVVGARESYARAIAAGRWAGFSCSLTSTTARDKAAVRSALSASGATVLAAAAGLGDFDDARGGLLVDLVEHEVQHHGQLIRYLYGLKLAIPARWRARYALS